MTASEPPSDVSASVTGQPRTLGKSVLIGSLAFGLASTLVFSTVAFGERWMYQNLGAYGSYTIWAILFVILGGAALAPLRPRAAGLLRFYVVFAIAFLLYAVGWSAAYFLLGAGAVTGGGLSEWAASLAGSVLLGLTLAVGLKSGRRSSTASVILVLFIANSAGYFLGGAVFYAMHSRPGMVVWGVIYGLFLGAGLGAAISMASATGMVRKIGTN